MSQLFSNKWTALFTSNFLGVFNDNLLKNSVIFIATGWLLPSWLTQSQLISIVSASLVIPYIFLSPLGGRLAIVYSKKKVFLFFKLLEIPIMLVACLAFYKEWVLLAIASVLLMGTQSCLYSPSKYSLIRDIGKEEGVSFGSGAFEAISFIGILTGTVTASFVSDHYQKLIVFSLFIGLAFLGYIVTRTIKTEELPENKEEISEMNPVKFFFKSYRFIKNYPLVNSGVLGAAAFWLIGNMIQMNLIIHTKQIYQASNTTTGIIMATAAIGIAFGMFLAGKISGKTVKKGLILVGLGSMSALLLLLSIFKLPFYLYAATVFLLAMSGGLFEVPCMSIIQQSDLGRKLGDAIAYLNLITFIFILIGTAIFWSVSWATHENSYAVFASILIVCIITAIYFIRRSPVFLHETRAIIKNQIKQK